MSENAIDPDRVVHMELLIGFEPIDLPCSLCSLPVGREYPSLKLYSLPNAGQMERYCEECYRCLWIEGHHFIQDLPDPEIFEYEGVVEPSILYQRLIEVPCYLVKGSGLKLFEPTDPVEIGRIRATNLKLREEDLDEPKEELS